MPYPFRTMSEAEVTSFLAEPRHAIVATTREDGSPQISPVWFLYEEGRIYFSMQSTSAKHANLRRDPRLAICVDAGHPDARFVTLLGRAELHVPVQHEPVEESLHYRIARRYASSDEETARYLETARSVGGLILVSVSPDRVLAREYN